MPRSTLTVATVPSWGAGLVDSAFQAVDNVNGDEFVITKPTLVLALNSSGGAALTMTTNLPATRHTANAVATKTTAIADTKIGAALMLPGLHTQAAQKCWLDWSAGTATVALLVFDDTPGF